MYIYRRNENTTQLITSTHNVDTCCTEGRESSCTGNKRISFIILAHRTGSSLRRNTNDCFADALLVPIQCDTVNKNITCIDYRHSTVQQENVRSSQRLVLIESKTGQNKSNTIQYYSLLSPQSI